MQKTISSLTILVLYLASVQTSLGSVLIFKAVKTVSDNSLTEIGSFDASKYRQIRIGVKIDLAGREMPETTGRRHAQLVQRKAEINGKLGNLRMVFKEHHPDVVAARREIE